MDKEKCSDFSSIVRQTCLSIVGWEDSFEITYYTMMPAFHDNDGTILNKYTIILLLAAAAECNDYETPQYKLYEVHLTSDLKSQVCKPYEYSATQHMGLVPFLQGKISVVVLWEYFTKCKTIGIHIQ